MKNGHLAKNHPDTNPPNQEDVNFDIGYALTSSQEIEETHHTESQVLSQETNQDDARAPEGNSTMVRNSTHHSTTTSRTQSMRFQQSPFVLNNCNVTINYYTK